MRQRLLFLALLLCSACILRAGWTQESAGGFLYSRYRQFQIPFNPPSTNIKQLQLFVSTDQGKSWQPAATAPPEQKKFRFVTDRDGYFWFTVQTTDLDNKLYPANLDNAQPSLKVVVDTVPPTIALQPLAPRAGEVGVSWEITDDNLDLALPDAARLEYRPAGASNWLQLPMPPGASKHYWNPQANGQVEVRLRARDRAGNYNETATNVSLAGAQGNQGNPGIDNSNTNVRPPDVANGPAPGDLKLVNNKRISLNYEVKDVGPSGVSGVELWYTQDGRGWNKYPLRFGEDGNQKNMTFDVVGEGLYGITLVAKSGVGISERAPQIGDRPQVWIEVDLKKPEAQVGNVTVGAGADKGKLTVNWSARDKNLGKEPIALSYAETAAGPWTKFADKLANSGRHAWTMPEGVPYQFHIKVEAFDLAGNIGESVTEHQVKVDLSQPKVKIITVEPAGK